MILYEKGAVALRLIFSRCDSPFCFRRIVVTAHAHEGSEQQWAFRYGSELSRKSPKGFFLFDDKGSDIGIGCRHGHSAEDTVAFAPCDDPDVVAGILFDFSFLSSLCCCDSVTLQAFCYAAYALLMHKTISLNRV